MTLVSGSPHRTEVAPAARPRWRGWKHTLSVRGRIGRKEFWITWGLTVLSLGLASGLAALLIRFGGGPGEAIGQTLWIPWLIGAAWVSVATQVKRWHDLDRSGWMVLICLIPYLGFFINIVWLGFIRGTAGPNRFGPPPGAAAADIPPIADAPAPPPPAVPPVAKPSRWPRVLAWGGALLFVVTVGGAFVFYLVPPPRADYLRCRWRAAWGDAEATFLMGAKYRLGDGVQTDDAAAMTWFTKAAIKGHAAAQYQLGHAHFYGHGAAQDVDQAMRWLEASAGQGHAGAMTLLGVAHASSDPFSESALGWWRQAAEAGDAWAESLLGSAYLTRAAADESEESRVLALYWLETARTHGAERIGGLLQHAWANVPPEQKAAITDQVFARLAQGSPDRPPETTAADAELPTEMSEHNDARSETGDGDAPAETTDANDAPEPLGTEVLEYLREVPDYRSVSVRFAERIQQDPAWASSDEGAAVSDYLQQMRTDAEAAQLIFTDDGRAIEYTIAGATRTESIDAESFAANDEYRRLVLSHVARNIAAAPRPLAVATFLSRLETR